MSSKPRGKANDKAKAAGGGHGEEFEEDIVDSDVEDEEAARQARKEDYARQ